MKQLASIKIDQIRLMISTRKQKLKINDMPMEITNVNDLFHLKEIFENYEIRATGKNGYTRSIIWGSSSQGGIVTVMFNPLREDMGLLIDFTATGKKMYESLNEIHNRKVNWRKIITKIYQEFKGHVTRIDIAIDFINYGLSVNNIHVDLCNKKTMLVNKLNAKIKEDRIEYIGSNNEVETIYIGSRRSDAFLRIYNKKKEQSDKNGPYRELANRCDDWIRIEGEFKHRLAHQIGAMISTLNTDCIEPYLANYIMDHWKLVKYDD